MKKCELCNSVARMYCDSDRAILCWACDTKVHTANFLVAKHHRTLLCHACQSPTPWTGSGPKLGPTVSVCETCVRSSNNRTKNSNGNYENSHNEEWEDTEIEEEEEEDDDDDGSESDEDEDDGDNQVVPLCSTPESLPLVLSSSSSEESSSRGLHSCRDDEPKSTNRVFF